MIIVLFCGWETYVTDVEQHKQLTTDFPAHKNVKVSFLCSFARRLVVCAASLARCLVVA